MNHGWPVVTLQEIAANVPYPIGDGDHGQIKPAMYETSGVPYIRVADIGWGHFEPKGLVHISESVHEENLKSELKPGDILIAKTGATIGKCCVVPSYVEKANTTSSVGKISVDQTRMLPKFLLYWFLTPEFQKYLWSISTRAAQPGFNIADMKLFKVPLPPLAEQQRLVDLLDKAFEGIAIAKANLEKNLLNARALFRGYLNSAFIEDNDRWQSKSFEDCIQLVQYTRKVQRKQFLSEGRFPIISQEADFNNGFWNDEADLFEVVRPVVIFGDHTRVLKYVDSSFVLGADGVRILSPHEFLNPKFFYYQLLGTDIRSLGYSRHYRLLKEIKIGFPGLEEQARVVSRLDDIARHSQKLADSYAQKLAALELLRASILGQLLMDKSKAA